MARVKYNAKISGRHVVVKMRWSDFFNRRRLFIAISAAVVAVFAAIQVAAQTGMPTENFGLPGRALNAPEFAVRPYGRELAERGRFRHPVRALKASVESIELWPLQSAPLTISGVAFDQQGHRRSAIRALQHATSITRREAVAQLWLANRAVRDNDATGALRRYDTILRTVPASGNDLMLRLIAVAQLPQGRAAIAPYIRGDTPWLAQFLDVAVNQSPRAQPIAELILMAPALPHHQTLRNAQAALIRRLAEEKAYTTLWSIYPRFAEGRVGQHRSFALPLRLGVDSGLPPVDWAMTSDGDFGATLDNLPGGYGTELIAFSSVGTRGIVANKIANLAPGRYRLNWAVTDQQGNPNSIAVFGLSCANGNAVATSRNMFRTAPSEQATRSSDHYFLNFTLPNVCPAVQLTLTVAGGEGSGPSEIVIADVHLAKIN